MDMAAPSATATDAAAARLLAVQLLSPAFPTGAFAYASGLEWAMDAGLVRDADSLRSWIADVLEHGAGWSDAVLLSLALRGEDVGDLAHALCVTSERLTETMEQGAAFARTAGALTGARPLPAALPVAVGRACAALPLPRAEVIGLFLHGQALNLIMAAVRFMPLGQTEGQRLLVDLSPLVLRLAARAAEATQADLGGLAIGADLASMHHETMPTRIFRT